MDVVVGGDVVEEVLTVGDQAPVVGSAVVVHGRGGVGGEPDLLLADQVLGQARGEERKEREEGEDHCCGSDRSAGDRNNNISHFTLSLQNRLNLIPLSLPPNKKVPRQNDLVLISQTLLHLCSTPLSGIYLNCNIF